MDNQNGKGKIIPNGVVLEAHETATVVYFTELGYDVELIPRSNIQGVHRPDIIMDGLEWEIKSPKGEGKWLIKNTLQKAKDQSENIIMDLRRVKIPQEKCLTAIKREFDHSKRIKRIKVITKKLKLLEYEK
ncbi:MAG: hypothetical protein J5883_00675 [Clostridiales bacterium]|nr:hypothetical protein [Clostridiales bacterium]